MQLWREACPGGETSVWTVDLAYLLTKLGKDTDSNSITRPFRPTFFTTATEAKAEYAEYGFCEWETSWRRRRTKCLLADGKAYVCDDEEMALACSSLKMISPPPLPPSPCLRPVSASVCRCRRVRTRQGTRERALSRSRG